MTDTKLHNYSADDFDDIRPYTDKEFHQKMAALVREPGFEHAVRYVMPDVNYDEFADMLTKVKNQDDFQRRVMGQFLELLASTTTRGVSLSGKENLSLGRSHVYITNHRDIVLDASFLNLCFIRDGLPLTQVAIGNNLLIYDWITDLVKLNRSFVVKRDTGVREALAAARHLSSYIHFAVTQQNEPVWIAQREGRAKDSNDRTQEAVIKMLILGGQGSAKESLLELNIMPVAISYEYDPNDYLKAREFLLKRRDPSFKKSQRDDLFSMETGLLQQKGRVHMHLCRCLNDDIAAIAGDDRAEVVPAACALIDKEIHRGYFLYPCNYIAYDAIEHTDRFSTQYNADDVAAFNAYLDKQLDQVDVPDVTPEERQYMRNLILTMYSNPVKNKLAAK